MGFMVKSRVLKSGDTGVVVPVGTTANRPLYATVGQLRYNEDNCRLEYYNGSQFIAVSNYVADAADTYRSNGDGINISFGPLASPVDAPEDVLVFVGQLYQTADAYQTNGTNYVEFTEPPPNGATVTIIKIAGRNSESACDIAPEMPK